MRFDELIQLYFERSNALQWYWTLYVVVIGGLLAFSSLRQRPDLLTAALVTVLFGCFAYKNCQAIGVTTAQRQAILAEIRPLAQADPSGESDQPVRFWQSLEPTLNPSGYEDVRNFHIACDALTIAAVWAMEWRRWRKRASALVQETES